MRVFYLGKDSLCLSVSLSFVSTKSLLAFALDFFFSSPRSCLVAAVASLCDLRVRLRFESFNLNVPSVLLLQSRFSSSVSTPRRMKRFDADVRILPPLRCTRCV
jgi:hypothetical protein